MPPDEYRCTFDQCIPRGLLVQVPSTYDPSLIAPDYSYSLNHRAAHNYHSYHH